MMECPSCKGEAQVVDSRQTGPLVVRRRRGCLACSKRFTTYEIAESAIDQTLVFTFGLELQQGRLVVRSRSEYQCACGNAARYIVAGESDPRFCGLCDLEKNEGKGVRQGAE